MKREIRFRAWDNSISKMIEWDELSKRSMDGHSYYGLDLILKGESHHYHPMQFTGLYDKNGKEIYEGDVVKEMIEVPFQRAHGTFSHKEVVYRSGMWVLSYLSSEKGFVLPRGYMASDLLSARESASKDIFFYDDTNPIEELEVIGNIYEHPNLLKQEA